MKLFVTGMSGLLGLNLVLQAREQFQVSGGYCSHPVQVPGVEGYEIDLRRPQTWQPLLQRLQPDVIVHTAGLTNVEQCQAQPELATQLNVTTTRHLAATCQATGIKLVHISTDHLFDGQQPWRSEADQPQPLNVYARTKWEAEQVVLQLCPQALVIRTNFFGWGTTRKASLSDWILQALAQEQSLTMFTDAFFTPILINDLVDLLLDLIHQGQSGLFHVAGGERLTKYDFALKLAEVFGYPTHNIRPIRLQAFPFKAPRPRDMSLSSGKLEQLRSHPMPTVLQGLQRLSVLAQEGWPQHLAQAIAAQPHNATNAANAANTATKEVPA